MRRAIVLTCGEPAGIGPEIIAKAFRDQPEALRGCFVAGDVASVRMSAQRWRMPPESWFGSLRAKPES